MRVDPTFISGSAGLQVTLGGIDGNDILGMSGGWGYTFTLVAESDVTVTFDYYLSIGGFYEEGEKGLMFVSLHGSEKIVAELEGGGISDPTTVTGTGAYVSFTEVSSGDNTVFLGSYNNQKTTINEVTTVQIANVKITSLATGN
jgi:hypothetical protein